VTGEFRPVTVVELSEFSRKAAGVLQEDEIAAIIGFLAYRPQAGELIQGTGGVRKLRWNLTGKGKRGGARVIYYYCDLDTPLFLITMFTKGQKSDLSPAEKAQARLFVQSLKDDRKRSKK
jgi:hypothetical protein